MPKDDRKAITPPQGEQKGLVNEVIVPLGQAGSRAAPAPS